MFYKKNLIKRCSQMVSALFAVGFVHSVQSLELAQSPLFLAQPVKPIVMLNMSNDHQLYFKAYDDYTDLNKDKVADTTYMNDYDYYGYFDSGKCYSYESDRFVPKAVAVNHYCDTVDGEWSGNFLNWATMTRMDAVRKILYGGFRSTDGDKNGVTVLERAFLPQDAHSFAKYYKKNDIAKLTAHNFSGGDSIDSGITLCNATDSRSYDGSTTVLSQTNNRAPKIMVAKGNYSLWASNERWQCRWGQGSNGNNPGDSGINAHSQAPYKNEGVEYFARVEVCKAGLLEDNCRSYPDGISKPAGLLQKYGERGEILFGLITGSYGRNKSGGVLRKNVADLSDEINVDSDGSFKSSGGIVSTLDKLRIYGYKYSGWGNTGTYNDSDADNCPWAMNGFSDGRCKNWGNPQSEIYFESLRYLAGKSAESGYASSDSSYISGLTSPNWVDPVGSANYCAALNIIQFNASSSSYDGSYPNVSDLNGIGSVDTRVNEVGSLEGIDGRYFVGESGDGEGQKDQLCTPKTVSNLSDVAGTCPDAPRLGGTYDIAGLAHYARTNDLRPLLQGEQSVKTFGVALAPAVPKVTIPVSDTQEVTILPACRNNTVSGNCAIVDFKIIQQDEDGKSGTLYVNWEDSEQGGDFDQDMWGLIRYGVDGDQVNVRTQVMAQSSGDAMGFGYVISGTDRDGFHVHSGINNFTYSPKSDKDLACGVGNHDCDCRVGNRYGGTEGSCNYDHPDAQASEETYRVGFSSASLLESPLFYAAKWGGYSNDKNGQPPSNEEIKENVPETYYYAIEPSELEENLSKALEQVAASAGSASSVATSSTRLGTDTVIYQALFNSTDWSGELKALKLKEDGTIGDLKWEADNNKFATASTRKIYTFNGTSGAVFTWDSVDTVVGISDAQKAILIGDDDEAVGRSRLSWVRGDDVEGLRDREKKLGDIVNSSPVFAGRKRYNFHLLTDELGGSSYLNYIATKKQNRTEAVYVGANDGMLHAFNANSGAEMFAYVPSGVYETLRNLTTPDYGIGDNAHRYSVDGPLFVGDAYVGGEWKNILVGTLGAGGKGIFALDVTNPASFDQDDVLFELTDADFPEIGNIMGAPAIVPTNDGWKLIFGNGYNSGNTRSRLMVVDLESPKTDTLVLETNDSGQNGLAGPSLLTNGRGVVIAAYAGDLLGNMWKFDLSSTDPADWGVSFEDKDDNDNTVNVPLFTAVDPAGKPQPITSTPTLGLNEQKDNAVMVYFGTGSYLTFTDNQAGDTVNSFYAIADEGAAVEGRSVLMQKTIAEQADGVRKVGNNSDQTWWAEKSGWYLDLIFGNQKTGERIISKPLLIYDRLLFPTMITSSDPCSFGGSGWQMELVAVGDRFGGHSIFGVDGREVDYAIISYSQVIEAGGKTYLPTSNIKGEFQNESGLLPPGAKGRISWRTF